MRRVLNPLSSSFNENQSELHYQYCSARVIPFWEAILGRLKEHFYGLLTLTVILQDTETKMKCSWKNPQEVVVWFPFDSDISFFLIFIARWSLKIKGRHGFMLLALPKFTLLNQPSKQCNCNMKTSFRFEFVLTCTSFPLRAQLYCGNVRCSLY